MTRTTSATQGKPSTGNQTVADAAPQLVSGPREAPWMPVRAAQPPLDLHEGIFDLGAARHPDSRLGGCKRWPEKLRLLSTNGELVMGRCRSTNLCEYCRTLYTIETVEMLTLDALEHAPEVWVVLTAREHLTRADCYRHLEQLRRAARKRWPGCEWFVQVEFQRRGALHLNLLVKGVPGGDADEFGAVLSRVWCRRVDAEPVGQWVGRVNDGVGVVKYVSKMLAHGLKTEQAPPIGWKGHRTSQTRGYLVRPASVMRVEARESLASKRDVWRARQAGLQAHDAELYAVEQREVRQTTGWRLVRELAPTNALRRSPRPRSGSAVKASYGWWRQHGYGRTVFHGRLVELRDAGDRAQAAYDLRPVQLRLGGGGESGGEPVAGAGGALCEVAPRSAAGLVGGDLGVAAVPHVGGKLADVVTQLGREPVDEIEAGVRPVLPVVDAARPVAGEAD